LQELRTEFAADRKMPVEVEEEPRCMPQKTAAGHASEVAKSRLGAEKAQTSICGCNRNKRLKEIKTGYGQEEV
jgi:hypothetical protein